MINAERRPLFLAAALWGALAMLVWIGVFEGYWTLPGSMSGLSWHIHEMVFGFAGAVIGGFLLTAVPTWTGRQPVTGRLLLGLVTLWMLGRLAPILPIPADNAAWEQMIAFGTAAVVLAYPTALMTVVAHDMISARYRRGIVVLGLVGLWVIANAGFHWELWSTAVPGISVRGGIAALIMLITLIGGRIVPAFTRNWLLGRGITLIPAEFGNLDRAALLTSLAALCAWVWAPTDPATAGLCALAGLLLTVRLCRWCGGSVLREPLLAVLHIGYGFIPAGFCAICIASLCSELLSPSAAIHLWTVGAVGIMATAIMTRAFLGHAGLPIRADGLIATVFVLLAVAIAARLAAALTSSLTVMTISGVAWSASLLVFFFRFFSISGRDRL